MRKPLIGVTPLFDEEKSSWWILPGYLEGLAEAGAHPVVLSFTDSSSDFLETASLFDGFLLTGGQDVDPSLYGETRSDLCGISSDVRDRQDLTVFHYCYENDVPLFGICRGLQLINGAMGGTLYQDLPSQHPSAVNHDMSAPYDRTAHTVRILPDTPLSSLLQKEFTGVNSLHHQAVKSIGKGLRTMAVSEDGLVESVYAPDRFFLEAVQWHPEYDFHTNENSRLLFSSFVRACVQYSRQK